MEKQKCIYTSLLTDASFHPIFIKFGRVPWRSNQMCQVWSASVHRCALCGVCHWNYPFPFKRFTAWNNLPDTNIEAVLTPEVSLHMYHFSLHNSYNRTVCLYTAYLYASMHYDLKIIKWRVGLVSRIFRTGLFVSTDCLALLQYSRIFLMCDRQKYSGQMA